MKDYTVKYRKNRSGRTVITKSAEFDSLDKATDAYNKLAVNYVKLAAAFAKSKIYGWIVTVLLIVSVLFNIFG